MNRLLVLALAAFASLALVHADFADAARMGGGRSFGMQRNITPPAPRATPPTPTSPSTTQGLNGPAANPVMPARPGATAAAPAAGAAATAGAAGSRASRWLGPIAGIAAGLGLAALFSHLGISDAVGSMLLIGLLVIGAVFLARALLARRAAPAPQYGGAARAPLDSNATRREPSLATAWGSGSDVPAGRYPPGFDPGPFVAQAKQQFRRVQEAYDHADRDLLADVTTGEMYAEITRDLDARGAHVATDIVTLEADVVEVVREGGRYVASVRFHGMLREDGVRDAQPFEETWHLVKPVDGSSGWVLAGIQQKDAHAAAA